ncbi:MAG: serine/threonine-protein kinase [Acidobacteria bacterium]|nr:serine/threonine-protein kinase [Acidobacteriota bacterium]
MTPQYWQQVEDLFHAALARPPAQRAAWLAEACPPESCPEAADLQGEVLSLLAAHEQAGESALNLPAQLVQQAAQQLVTSTPATLQSGQTLSHYQILSWLGRGGMGEVYLAEDTRLGRRVALKLLPTAFSQDAERVRRFEREARAASALNHPNIITIHEISTEGDTHFIATEYIEGETLRAHLANQSASFKTALEIAIQIASALEAAHTAGIIHRDIKPENVMIRPDGLVKILDFGIAKLAGFRNADFGMRNEEAETLIQAEPKNPQSAIRNPQATAPGTVMGTASYMAPEQAQGKTVDARNDIFSFGIVFYEMLTGRRPFAGETALESISSILKDEPVPMSRMLHEVPGEIERIVNKTLRKDREERYQTAKDLLLDLKEAKRDLEFHYQGERSTVPHQDAAETQLLPATPTNENQNQATSSAEYLVTQFKSHKFIYLTFAVLLMAGIGFGIYSYSDRAPVNNPFESVKISKLTDSGKVGDRVALSRDGKWLAYSIVEGEKASLWLKQVAIPDSNTQIAPPANIYYRELSFSPDGNYLYYSVLEGTSNNMAVYQMPVLGGTARKFLSGINGGISFSPDGKQITYGVEDLANDESILMVANADGTEQRRLVMLKGNDEIGSSRGRWSPDGKSIAVFVGTNNPLTRELATVSVATGEITRLATHKFSEFGLWEWLPDGKGFVVLARENPAHNNSFWLISYPSEEAQKITNDLNNVFSWMSLAADANILATVQISATSNIWIAPVGDTARATQVTAGSNQAGDPQWTPDGKLAYIRGLGDSQDIYLIDPQGGSPKRLTSNYINRHPRVSPDGRYIVYSSFQAGAPSIWRMDIDGSNSKQLTTEFSINPSISPNGQEVIYEVGVDTLRIWKVGIDGGQPVQLTDQESRLPIFSPDGKQFTCLWWDDPNSPPKIAIIPSTGGKPVKTFALKGEGYRWMPDGRALAYFARQDGVRNIWTQPIDGGAPKQLTNFTADGIVSFDFSRDGKQIAFTRMTTTSDVVLISGFRK